MNVLNLTAKEYYFGTLRPFLTESMLTLKTDEILLSTIEKSINATDGFIFEENWDDCALSFSVLKDTINDPNYLRRGSIAKASDEEKKILKEISKKIEDFFLLLKCAPPKKPVETKTKDRIGFKTFSESSPNGENTDYEHNMTNLTKCNPKKRIPNR